MRAGIRRRLRISLRTGLLLVTLLCVALGWRAHVVRQTELVITRLRQAGCVLAYPIDADRSMLTMGDYRRSPLAARFLFGYYPSDLPCLAILDQEFAEIESRVDDQTVSRLVEILRDAPWVDMVSLNKTYITGVSCEALASLPQLRHVSFEDTGLGKEDLDALAKLQQVKMLGLRGLMLSSDDLAELQLRLPDCEINHDLSAVPNRNGLK